MRAYSRVFWERYTELNDYERITKNIERGEQRIQRQADIMAAIAAKLDRLPLDQIGQNLNETLVQAAGALGSVQALSRDLNCALVQARDLTVRSGALFLKTLSGLQPIDVLLRRMPGGGLDPLEASAGSIGSGVTGLLGAEHGSHALLTEPLFDRNREAGQLVRNLLVGLSSPPSLRPARLLLRRADRLECRLRPLG